MGVRSTPTIRVVIDGPTGAHGQLWIRDPRDDRWIDVSAYVSCVDVHADVGRITTATVTFIHVATGAPQ